MTTTNGELVDQPPPRRLRLSSVVGGLFLGVVAAAVVALALVWFFARDDTPLLTPERLEAAADRWDEQGPDDYNLDLVVSGSQTGTIHVEVRDGRPVRMTRNGVATRSRDAQEAWTVPGQFEIMRRELEHADDPQQAFGVGDPSQVVLRADFDPELGYPLVYHRSVLGTERSIRWEVTRFAEAR